jgi:H+-transporting ATPase
MDLEIGVEEVKKISTSELFDRLSSDLKGLSEEDAEARLKYGINEISEGQQNHLRKFLGYFWGPIPWMIEFALIISLLIQHWPEFSIILLLLLINGLVGFFQEDRADNAIELLKEKLAYKARVLRGGKWVNVPSKNIVPGDFVKVHLGDIVPADIKLVEGGYVTVDESSLTGESLPVDKTVDDIIYSGSIIQKGQMNGIVFATGMNTYFGKAAGLVSGLSPKSHLQRAVITIGDYLIVLDLIMVSLIFIAGLIRHESFFDILGFALVLTIASIPVAQPAVLSVTLTVGAMAMAKKKAIVSKLTAIEELAGMDVLFSDKTGTLTKNEISIAKIEAYNGFTENEVIFYAGLASLRLEQDPLDRAILDKIESTEVLSLNTSNYKILKFNPFDPIRKSTESEIQYKDSEFKVSKGAPQVILSLLKDQEVLKTKVERNVDHFATKGYRSLGVAKTGPDNDWQFMGLIALYDPPKKSSKKTIADAKSMGIDVKMITGDHIAIAKQIAKELDLSTNIKLPASFLDLPEDEGVKVVEEASGFAEVFPEHKYRILELLQNNDKIVGMTGDGVNDAPALKKADAGIYIRQLTLLNLLQI